MVIAIVLLANRVHPEELKGRIEEQARPAEAAGLGGDREAVAVCPAPNHAWKHLRARPDRFDAKCTADRESHLAPGGQDHHPIAQMSRTVGDVSANGSDHLSWMTLWVTRYRRDFDPRVWLEAHEGELHPRCGMPAGDGHQHMARSGDGGWRGEALEPGESRSQAG